MKKTWLNGIALAIGVCGMLENAQAQYGAPMMGPGALAPNGYAIQRPGILARPIAYPQEQIATPGFNAQQTPTQGWIGPVDGQYQGVPVPQVPSPPQPVPMNPPGSGAPYTGPITGVPPQPAQGQMSYSQDPMYGHAIAPNAMGYSGCGDGSCGTGACGTSAYGMGSYGACGYPTCGPAPAPSWGNRLMGLCGAGGCGGNWFLGGGALLFQRVDDHPVALSYNVLMPSENTLTTANAEQSNLPGFEVFAGRYFNCGRNAIMVDYWGLFPGDKSATALASGSVDLRSRYQFAGLWGPASTIYDYYDNTQAHRILRGSDYNNVEVNLLGFGLGGAARSFGCASPCNPCGDCGPCGAGSCGGFAGPCGLTPAACGSRLNMSWLAGVRWFQFRERLQYASSTADTMFTGAADDFYFDNNVQNDLVGFQLGNSLNYCCGSRVNLYAFGKAGVYNNRANYYTRVGTNAMPATIQSTNIFNGQNYMVDVTRNNAAFIGELGTGVGVRICRGWSANAGYRVMGVSGVATSTNSIPFENLHLGNVGYFNNTSSLLLHGANLGLSYNF